MPVQTVIFPIIDLLGIFRIMNTPLLGRSVRKIFQANYPFKKASLKLIIKYLFTSDAVFYSLFLEKRDISS